MAPPLALVATLAAAPLAAQAVAGSESAQLDAVEKARAAGDFDRARALLEPMLAAAPDNPDLLRRMAMIDAGAGRLDQAQRGIDRAAALAPNDLDVTLARGFILAWQGELSAAREAADAIAARDPDYPELSVLRETLARQRAQDRVRIRAASLVFEVSDIKLDSGARSTWTSQGGVLAADLSPVTTVTVGIAREKRRAVDTRLTARMDRRLGSGFAYLSASAVPHPDFQERWSLGAGGETAIASNLTALVDGRVARYDTGTIVAFQPGLRYRVTSRASLTGRAIAIFEGGDQRLGGAARVDYSLPNEGSLFAIAASYPDAEAGGVRQLRSAAAGVTWPVAKSIAVTAAGSHEDRKDSYRRWSGSLALTYRFGVQ